MKLLSILIFFLIYSSSAFAVSFDCSKASTFIEKAICSDPLLGKLDDALSSNYKAMLGADGISKNTVRQEQRMWLANRNKCTNNKCLIDMYRKRVDETCDYGVPSGVHPICIMSDDIQSSKPSTAGSGSPLLIIKAVPQTTPDKGIKSRSPVEVTGKIGFGHDAAGGNFWINGGKKKQYTLGYVWDIDDATQAQLGTIADSGATVTVKGTLKVWKDGSAAFDNADPISIFK